MRWRVRKPGARFRARKLWHSWFAWYPVRVPCRGKMSGMTLVWGETIMRRMLHKDYSTYDDWEPREYQFKEI